MGQIIDFNNACEVVRKFRREGKKTVFVVGFFDLLSRGHLTLLLEAKKHGDVLIVAVDSDHNARILKGPDRPINNPN